ncbi:hypothetical protein AVP42_01842 [Agromyces sp. NDB4Y10]|uniref:Uncharacterized protein n=1 Tax=Agromyces indicus TaxID=758919 RepID=A0ABU1FGY4_9MICO|nr:MULTISPECIES: hypothetical protein [Agromyces]KZE93555.1 hypothetical protein AVP42_01842 [Agromyces sp. NDB4Y10]MDR5691021.1 hypothetical protein [Agromyces indicus]
MADERTVADRPADTTDGIDALGVDAVEVHDSAARNAWIAVVGIAVVIAALVPLVYGAVWVGSIVYAAVLSFLTGGPAEVTGTAV